VQSADGLDVVVEDLRALGEDRTERLLLDAEEVRIVAAKCPAPRSSRSSRSTDVTTTCSSPICAAVLASRSGSSGSGGCSGLPEWT
jgi:hypothetical protein